MAAGAVKMSGAASEATSAMPATAATTTETHTCVFHRAFHPPVRYFHHFSSLRALQEPRDRREDRRDDRDRDRSRERDRGDEHRRDDTTLDHSRSAYGRGPAEEQYSRPAASRAAPPSRPAPYSVAGGSFQPAPSALVGVTAPAGNPYPSAAPHRRPDPYETLLPRAPQRVDPYRRTDPYAGTAYNSAAAPTPAMHSTAYLSNGYAAPAAFASAPAFASGYAAAPPHAERYPEPQLQRPGEQHRGGGYAPAARALADSGRSTYDPPGQSTDNGTQKSWRTARYLSTAFC